MSLRVKSLSKIAAVIIIFIASGANAQDYRPGYVVKNNLDSINGFVAYRSDAKNQVECLFRQMRKNETIRFNPGQLKTFGFYGDKQFRSMNFPQELGSSQKVFAKQLVRGRISLLKIDKNFVLLVKDSLIFLPVPKSKDVKNSEGNWSKKDKRYVGILNYLIKDCQLSADESSYTEGDLTNLLQSYNRCKGVEVSLTNQKPLGKLNFLFFGGYARSKMEMDLFTDVAFSPSYSVLAGAGLELSSPRIFDRLFFTAEAWYHDSFYQAYDKGPFAGNIRHQDIFVDVSYVKIPVGFKYNFRSTNTPYVKVGMSFTALNKINVRTFEEVEAPDGTVYADENFGGYNVKDPKGIWMAFGYERIVFGKLKMFGELRYERGEGFIGTPIQSFSKLNNYNLLLGIRF
jgi:hypothetical protein